MPRLRLLWTLSLLVALLAGCISNGADDDADGSDAGTGPTVTSGLPAPNADVKGYWEAPFDGEVPAVNMVLLDNGRVLYWSGVEANETDGATDATFFTSDPLIGVSRVVDLSGDVPVVLTPASEDGAGEDLFCSGQVILPDGRVLTIGASEWYTLDDTLDDPKPDPIVSGGTDARVYDPETNAWTLLADMNYGRWYPSILLRSDGTPWAVSGIQDLTNPLTMVQALETYDAAEDTWSIVEGADNLLPMYPRVTEVPGGPLRGHLFYDTVGALWGPFGEHPLEATWSLQQALDPETGAWTTLGPSVFGARQHAASVMLPLDPDRDYAPEFVTFGGTLQRSILAVPFTERNDLSTNPPTNTPAAPMNQGRWHLNGVLLPTGDILAVGGGMYDNVVVHGQDNIPIMSAELYDADTDTWTTLAEMEVPRMYHSTAVLLPDGRVLTGGHVPLPNPFKPARDTINPQVKETRLEIFDPPYMYWDRPVITAAPENLTYGQTFTITVDSNDPITSVLLMHPGATTHSHDMQQRGVLLKAAQEGTTVTVQAPPDPVVAPPGSYMLFVTKDVPQGTAPSKAVWIHLE